jgi:hypothetical protein
MIEGDLLTHALTSKNQTGATSLTVGGCHLLLPSEQTASMQDQENKGDTPEASTLGHFPDPVDALKTPDRGNIEP